MSAASGWTWDTASQAVRDMQDAMNQRDELELEQEQLVRYIAQRLSSGVRSDLVTDELTQAGWSWSEADHLVNRIYQSLAAQSRAIGAYQHEIAEQYRKRMLYGILWMVGGAVVSLVTFLAASGGGVFFLFWGAVLWGAIDFIRGFIGWLNYRKLLSRNSLVGLSLESYNSEPTIEDAPYSAIAESTIVESMPQEDKVSQCDPQNIRDETPTRCPSCGDDRVSPDDRFCRYCGTSYG